MNSKNIAILENNIVINIVVVTHDTWTETENQRVYRKDGFRKQVAKIGGRYDPDADVFIDIQPYPSWILDDEFDWQPPTPKPDDGENYSWNEETTSWDESVGVEIL
jgi:hypothetical protein